MRGLPRWLAAAVVLLVSGAQPARAQQGSVQISGSAQTLHGAVDRLGGQPRVEPDLSISWLQPGSRFGVFQMEVRATRRGPAAHLGRTFLSWSDLKYRDASWTLEAGDFYFTPAIGDYRFSNLTAPWITVSGASVSAKGTRWSAQALAGRTTAWRNIFGSDPETLGQRIAVGRFALTPVPWLDVNARASHVRTRDVGEFAYRIRSSDQAGGGGRAMIGPVHVVADGSYVAYRRAGSDELVHDTSGTAGASVLLSRGWLQANVSRFSPGEFPVVNYPFVDRQSAFAAGEYDLFSRLRLFAGWEQFESNLDPGRAAAVSVVPELEGSRAFGGARLRVARWSSVVFRIEDGDRRTRKTTSGLFTASDTGMKSAELQGRLGEVTGFLRYSRRDNVEHANGMRFTQSDGTAQVFLNVSRNVQLFGTGMVTRNEADTGEASYIQFGGGGQFQLNRNMLSVRLEGLAARSEQPGVENFVARESFNIGINGQVARNTTMGLNLFTERSPGWTPDSSPWFTRSMLRVTRTFPTGMLRLAGSMAAASAEPRGRGTGLVVGSVFADWNGDGLPGAGEDPLENIAVLLVRGGSTRTSPRGDFTFTNVPVGAQRVEVDVTAIPVDFDPPATASVEVAVSRNESRRVAFGLVPLGTIMGRVLRDANGNGAVDPADEPMDGAVLALGGGSRSEQARKGRYRFDAVRSGEHRLELLLESLPDGASFIGEGRVMVALAKDRMTGSADFLVRIDKRPEIRKVFPPKGGAASTSATSARRGGAVPSPRAAARGERASGPIRAPADAFTIQVAALASESRARVLAQALKAIGHAAQVVSPPRHDPEGLYRIRVGDFRTRGAAEDTRAKLEQLRGEKLWIVRAR